MDKPPVEAVSADSEGDAGNISIVSTLYQLAAHNDVDENVETYWQLLYSMSSPFDLFYVCCIPSY